jgi:hypothetical protein
MILLPTMIHPGLAAADVQLTYARDKVAASADIARFTKAIRRPLDMPRWKLEAWLARMSIVPTPRRPHT